MKCCFAICMIPQGNTGYHTPGIFLSYFIRFKINHQSFLFFVVLRVRLFFTEPKEFFLTIKPVQLREINSRYSVAKSNIISFNSIIIIICSEFLFLKLFCS